jgi:hypothetical protein
MQFLFPPKQRHKAMKSHANAWPPILLAPSFSAHFHAIHIGRTYAGAILFAE